MRFTRLFIILLALSMLACKKGDPEVEEGKDLIPTSNDPGPLLENASSIEGYANLQSYFPDDSVYIMASTAQDSLINFSLFRIGKEQELITSQTNIPSKRQDYYKYSYSFGCDWDTTFSFKLDESLKSGLYTAVIKNQNNNTDYISFVVKESWSAPKAEILVVAPTNTWQAYNPWGGGSFYRYELNDENEDIRYSVIVSFNRPNKVDSPFGNNGHLTNTERHLLEWLETEGYNYAMICDQDLHDSEAYLEGRKALVLHVHPEYYTLEMMNHVKDFNADGGSLLYLGANGLYWQVMLSDLRRIECRKDGDSFKYGPGTGGLWSEQGFSPATIVGSHYSKSGYDTYAPYTVVDDSHWLFEGTNLKTKDLFGENSLNNEAASGHETDKMTADTPSGFKLIAKGTNPENGGAELLVREIGETGFVFSVGSLTYTGALSVDENISIITKNAFNHALAQ